MILDTLRTRRSKRKYLDKSIPKDIVDNIIETALRVPSSRGKRPWEFYVITNKDVLAKLALAKPHGALLLENAPLAIAVVADEDVCDVWIEDASIAAFGIQIAAEELGLGSCWVQLRKRDFDEDTSSQDYAKEVLGLDKKLKVPFIIGMGYSEEELAPVGKEKLLYDKVHYVK